jgi:hypothetical protein
MNKLYKIILLNIVFSSAIFAQLPISEGFENIDFPPVNWSQQNINGEPWIKFNSGSVSSHSGVYTAQVYMIEGGTGTKNSTLFSPEINFNAGDKLRIQCYVYRSTLLTSTTTFKVLLASLPNISNITNELSNKTSWINNSWELIDVSYTFPSATTAYVGFQYLNPVFPSGEIFLRLDDINIEKQSCNPPIISELTYSSPSSAYFYLQAPTTDASYISSYQYQIALASAAAPDPGAWITTTPGLKYASGLSLGESYKVYSRSICDAFTTEYSTSAVYQHNPPCITPTGLSSNPSYNNAQINYSAPNWIANIQYEVSTTPTFDAGTIIASQTITNSILPILISGLNDGTIYYYRIRSICPLGLTCTTSCEWASDSFITLTCNDYVLPPQMTENSSTQISFSWISPGVGLNQSYVLEDVTSGGNLQSGSIDVNTETITLSGLSLIPGHSIRFTLTLNCAPGVSNTPSSINFTACNAAASLPYYVDFSTIPPNTIPCNWLLNNDAMNDGWKLQFIPISPPTIGLTWTQDFSNNDWAFSPNFNFMPGLDYELQLDFFTLANFPSSLKIYITDSYDPSVISTLTPFYTINTSTNRNRIGIPFQDLGNKHFVFHSEGGVDFYLIKMNVQQLPNVSSMIVSNFSNNDVCNTFQIHNVNSISGSYQFYDFNGNIVASILPQGLNLGTVTLQMKDKSSVESYLNAEGLERFVLPRTFSFSSSNFAHGVVLPSPVRIRINFTDAELQQLRTASGIPTLLANEITFTHFSAPSTDCDIVNNFGVGTSEISNSIANWTTIDGGYGLEFIINHFSEFIPHTPSISPLSNPVVLPLQLVAFNASKKDNNSVQILWKTINEEHFSHFELERSIDLNNFKFLYKINSNNQATNEYQYIDNNLIQNSNIIYYRLKMIDDNLKIKYSKIISVRTNIKNQISIYPNPTEGYFNLINANQKNYVIYSITGEKITSGKAESNEEIINTQHLNKGIYYIQIEESKERLKLIKQ